MLESYEEIFAQRGQLYHQAMTRYPRAREEEFRQIITFANLHRDAVVCDIPAGAGYLGWFEPPGTIVHVETSAVFAGLCRNAGREVVLGHTAAIPLRSHSMDRVVSIAALHHVADKAGFYREAHRVLRGGGALCIADVRRHSPVASFLEEFVHAHSSRGHRGTYLDEHAAGELSQLGFTVTHAAPVSYHWRFDSRDDLVTFFQLLFGIDRAGPAEVQQGLLPLGCEMSASQWTVNWELLFVKAIKR